MSVSMSSYNVPGEETVGVGHKAPGLEVWGQDQVPNMDTQVKDVRMESVWWP